MKWLLWKDFRHNRLIVYASLAFVLLPYVITSAVVGWAYIWRPELFQNIRDFKPAQLFAIAGIYSIGLSIIGIGLLGGNAIAGERTDRSAEFLFILPVSRQKLLVSKLLLTAIFTASVWLVNLFYLWCLTSMVTVEYKTMDTLVIFFYIVVWELSAFCIAWFVSSYSASPSLGTLVGLVGPILVSWIIVIITNAILNLPNPDHYITVWWPIINLTLAPVCFAIGTWHYLRRVEP
jgi:ABC-type transport system involved in multi-copper enzyme maturation permease subunit